MQKQPSEIELQEIESQLRCPSGQKGVEIGEMMNETNIGMTLETIKNLNIQDKSNVLEIGHGNCGHLTKLLNQAKNITYYGLEISETMCEESKKNNSKLTKTNKIDFRLYDGNSIPFPDNSFDRIMTVNTLYFWENPVKFLNEICRVLKPEGIFILTFAHKKFMKTLPFVKQKFRLYDNEDIQKLVENVAIKLTEITEKSETVKSKTGILVERKYSMVKMKKTNKITHETYNAHRNNPLC